MEGLSALPRKYIVCFVLSNKILESKIFRCKLIKSWKIVEQSVLVNEDYITATVNASIKIKNRMHPPQIQTYYKTSLKSLRLRKLLDLSALAYWILLDPSGSIFTDHTRPYLALLGLTGPYWALLGLTGPY